MVFFSINRSIFDPNYGSLNCAKIEKETNGVIKREDILPDYPWDELR